MLMIVELLVEVCKLVLVVCCLRFAIRTYAQFQQPKWSLPLARRYLAVLLVLAFAVVAIKLVEDVITEESGIIDRNVLLFIHAVIPSKLTPFFELATATGSSTFLLPLTIGCTLTMLVARHRLAALLLSASVVSAAAIVYVLKMAVDRVRPALWEANWYWGSSFPSGHTLVTAAFATALAVCVSRAWPSAQPISVAIAVTWISIVALSRLVLGVHWPTDVLAAACIGVTIPLAMSVAIDLRST
jgi:undecaprenyl-diphosphatase